MRLASRRRKRPTSPSSERKGGSVLKAIVACVALVGGLVFLDHPKSAIWAERLERILLSDPECHSVVE